MVKTNNKYLKTIANNTGSENNGHRTDNYYLKQIAENTEGGTGGGGSGTNISQTITDGDTTHAPSGNAVFDALALKQDTSSAFSGSYEDLTYKPTLFSGSYNDLSDKPTLFSGSYNDLSNKPTIPSDVSDLTDNSNTQFTPKTHSHTVSDITNFPDLEFVKITTNKGTASASTMNKLFIEIKNNKTDAYYSIENNGSYSWEKLDENILEDITIPTDVSDLTDTNDTQFTPKSHTHGISDLNNMATVPITITYTDNTTETVSFVKLTPITPSQ